MIIIGLTGGIGMGKTTTAKMFEQAGAYVFFADQAVHKLYDKGGKAVPLIKAVFPDAIQNGAINRQILMKHLAKDPLNFEVLESFIHPMVAELREQEIKKAREKGYKIFIADIPLLFETNGHLSVDKIIVVNAPKHIQRKRVLARDGMSEEKLQMIIARQTPEEIKIKHADYIIDTSKGLEHAKAQVNKIMKELSK